MGEGTTWKPTLIKLPCSTLSRKCQSRIVLFLRFAKSAASNATKLEVPYFDLSDHSTVGIDDRHFIYPGSLFNPGHLNYQGAAILTSHLLKRLDESRWIAPLLSSGSEKVRLAER